MLTSILVFLIVLSILVLVHEFGHFITAIKAGVPVLEFGFGIPPRIFGKKIGNTIYSINLLPFGGFVRLFGENGEEEDKSVKIADSKAFINKPKKVRVMIIVAGVIMNFLLGIFAFAIVYSFSGIPRDTGKLKVVDVSAGSPAQVGGLIVGDIIKKVEKVEVNSVGSFVDTMDERKGKPTSFEVERSVNDQKSTLVLKMTPRETPPPDEGPLGVIITTTEIYFPPAWQRPFYGVYYGFKDAIFWGETVLSGLGGLVASIFRGQVPQDISGPVGIFAVTSAAAKSGILTLINFVGILSVNLAILNIMPFPALDGGRLLFIVIESIFGKKILPKAEAIVHTVGMALLLLLLVAITIHDIRRLIAAGGIAEFLTSFTR